MWGKIKGVWLLSQEDRTLRDDLITVLQYTGFVTRMLTSSSFLQQEEQKEISLN